MKVLERGGRRESPSAAFPVAGGSLPGHGRWVPLCGVMGADEGLHLKPKAEEGIK